MIFRFKRGLGMSATAPRGPARCAQSVTAGAAVWPLPGGAGLGPASGLYDARPHRAAMAAAGVAGPGASLLLINKTASPHRAAALRHPDTA